MLKCIVLFLLVSLNAKSQTLQQQIDQLSLRIRLDSIRLVILNAKLDAGQRSDSIKMAKITYQMNAGQKADSLNFVRVNYLISTLTNQFATTNATVKSLSNYVLGLRTDSIKKTFQIGSLQRQDSIFKVNISDLTFRVRSLELDSMYQAKQIAQLQKINTLNSVGSLKIIKTGTLAYEIRQDSASRTRPGNLTTYMYNYIKSLNPSTAPPAPSNPSSTIPIHNNPIPNETIRAIKTLPKQQ